MSEINKVQKVHIVMARFGNIFSEVEALQALKKNDWNIEKAVASMEEGYVIFLRNKECEKQRERQEGMARVMREIEETRHLHAALRKARNKVDEMIKNRSNPDKSNGGVHE